MAEQQLVGSLETHVEVVGEGVPVVLLHGLGLSGALWNRVRDAFGPGYQLIVPDLRAAGDTREIEHEELSLERWADDLVGLFAALGVERPVIVGHSLGASIALKVALEHPEHVRALVLIGADATLSNLAPRMLASAERIETMGIETWVAEYWSQNPPFSSESLERAPEILAEYRDLVLANDPADYVRQCRAIAVAEDLSGRLGEITQPALVLIGAKDDRTLPEQGRALAEQLGDARVTELPNVGHTLPLEAPDAVATAVRTFLEDVAPGARRGAAGGYDAAERSRWAVRSPRRALGRRPAERGDPHLVRPVDVSARSDA